LESDQEYVFRYQGFIDDNKKSPLREGKFKTLGKKSAEKFNFVVSSCANSMSDSNTFDHIRELSPDLFINIGDLHYSGFNKSQTEEFIFAYHELFKSEKQRKLYESTPFAYTFDDHDFGSNNADGFSHSSPHANRAYRVRSFSDYECVKSY
jgi:phosphodiesterase/alkaline phosphatase D-like protein